MSVCGPLTRAEHEHAGATDRGSPDPTLVRALYEAGATERSIAQQLRVPRAAVTDTLASAQVERRQSGRPCPLTADQLQQLVDSGATQATIAAMLHAAPGTVSRWLAEIGVGDPDPRIDRTELRRLYVDQQLTIREVADRLNVPKNRIIRDLTLAGIPRRSRHSRRPRGPRLAVTAERLTDLYVNQGLTLAQLGAELQVSEGYLRRRLRESGITERRGTFGPKPASTNRVVARACLLYTSGLSMTAVGAELGISATQVALILAEADIPVRRPGPRPLYDDPPTRRVLTQLYQDPDVRQALERWNIDVQDSDNWERPTPFQSLAPDPLPPDLLRHLYNNLGLTIHHISILTGIGTTGVKGQLHRLGITPRPPGPSPWTRRHTAI